jgi:hypothetical protein
MSSEKQRNPIRAAGIHALASACNLTYEAVRKWALRGEVPSEHLTTVVRLAKAPPCLLAPKLYRQVAEAEAAWQQIKETP